jgi:tripartite-type tricarboxylate transporter receptor subunit TctC
MVSRRSLLKGSLVLPWAAPTIAQPFGSRPLKIVVGAAPGGGNDIFARLYAPELSRLLDRPVIVEDRAGAGGQIGAEYVAKSPPDGNTMFYAASSIVTNAYLIPSPWFDPQKSLTAVSLVLTQPFLLVANGKLGVQSLAELLELAKKKPNSMTYGAASPAGPTSLIPKTIYQSVGVNATEVPYRGTGPVAVAVMAGEVDVACVVYPTVSGQLTSRTLVALAATSPIRQLPSVPTLAANGFPELTAGQWHGMFVPAGTPPAMVDEFSKAIAKVVRIPKISERIESEGASPVGGTPAEFAAFFAGEMSYWGDPVRRPKPMG